MPMLVFVELHFAVAAVAAAAAFIAKMIPARVLRAAHANPRRLLLTNATDESHGPLLWIGTPCRFWRGRGLLRKHGAATLGLAIHYSELLLFLVRHFENVLLEFVQIRLLF